MTDIRNPRLMYLKAVLFVVVGVMSAVLILSRAPQLEVAIALAITIWSFSRAYYFAFYVVEKYIDPGYRFAGLGSLLIYLLRRQRSGARKR